MRKFPLYRQHDSMQCGVTCLRMICAYWGKEYPAEYLKRYRYYFGQVFLGLTVGSLLQLLFPFLTQAIVDLGIDHEDLGLIWLILLGQLVLVTSQTALDFIQRWILLHVSMRVNISLVSDFFIKLLRLPMGFFDTRLMGDLMQRMGDHKRVEQYLTNEALTVLFSLLTFLVFGGVLLVYDPLIFAVFVAGSLLYGLWIAFFLGKRKRIDYELFEKEAENNNKTYRFITTMQEIKLQDCEQRRRWEWEDVQAGLFRVQAKSLKLRQAQEAGGILITQVKNILVTVLAATAVINGQMTLGMMLAVQYIIGQLNHPVEQLMRFIYASQDVKISLDRINEIHGQMEEEDGPIDTARLARAVEIANIKEFIQSLPLRYDTVIGPDGIELSALVPYRFAPRINGATPVVVRLEGTTAKATILRTGDETVANERGNFLRIVLLVRDATPGPYGPKVNMRGRASFTLSDKCLFRYLTGR